MSLLSPFSPFSPGEGVGSKALTHQQVPFSPFISSLSSQLPLFGLLLISPLCSSLFLSISRHLFSSCLLCSFSPATLCPPRLFSSFGLVFSFFPFPCNPWTSFSHSPSSSLSNWPCAFSLRTLFTLSPSSYSPRPPSLHSICFSLLITLCSPCFHISTSWKVEGRRGGGGWGGGGGGGEGGGWKQGSLEPEGQLILIRLQPAY